MGQRLIVHMMKHDEKIDNYIEVANAYFHWSAYTEPSLYIIKDILEALENDERQYKYRGMNRARIKAVNAFKDIGAKPTNHYLSLESLQKQYTDFEFEVATNRNDGLVETTEKGIENNNSWSEGDVWIYIDEGSADFNLYYNPIFRYDELTEDELEEKFKNAIRIDFDFITLDNIDTIMDAFENNEVIILNGELASGF